MKAFLHKLMFFNEPSPDPITVIEFAVVGTDSHARESEAAKIKVWYEENIGKPFNRVYLSPPIRIHDRIYSENSSKTIDWLKLQSQIPEQDETRPRGIGCIFRGPPFEEPHTSRKDIEQSIKYFLDGHRVQGSSFVFVRAKWNRRTGLRKAPVALFEASSIAHAADLVELHFLSSKPELTLTEWCCRIYVV
jgi:hypothetical protein